MNARPPGLATPILSPLPAAASLLSTTFFGLIRQFHTNILRRNPTLSQIHGSELPRTLGTLAGIRTELVL